MTNSPSPFEARPPFQIGEFGRVVDADGDAVLVCVDDTGELINTFVKMGCLLESATLQVEAFSKICRVLGSYNRRVIRAVQRGDLAAVKWYLEQHTARRWREVRDFHDSLSRDLSRGRRLGNWSQWEPRVPKPVTKNPTPKRPTPPPPNDVGFHR